MSLYTKYRPKTLEEVVGQRHIIDILHAQVNQGKFSSSYLLYGPRGTGKTTTARLIAKLANATVRDKDGVIDLQNDPVSALINEGKTLDYMEIDAASHTGVDNIREEILDKALYPPTTLKTKVYVIDEVHMLSKGAFNALLKIMEEPQPYVLFVLATTEIQKVPDTIISRCQVFNFKHMSVDQIVSRLEYIAKNEGFTYENEALRLIAKLSHGGMRDAIKYLEQVSILGAITQDHVSQFLGVVSAQDLQILIDALLRRSYNDFVTKLDELVLGGVDLYSLTKDLLLYCDEHFMSDLSFFASVSGVLQEIAAQMKRYPHPILVWKKKFYLYFIEQGVEIENQESTISKPTETTPPQQTKAEPKIETESVAKEETKAQPEAQTQQPQSGGTFDGSIDTLMEQILEKVEKVMVRSALKQHSSIQSLENGVLSIVVINEQFYTVLQKPETVNYLSDIVSAIVGEKTSISVTFMTKEEYLSIL